MSQKLRALFVEKGFECDTAEGSSLDAIVLKAEVDVVEVLADLGVSEWCDEFNEIKWCT
jgi:hypothetical protein